MKTSQNTVLGGPFAAEPCPTLRQRGLGDEELAALRRQGYLQWDPRLAGRVQYARLRFRFQGKSRTIYLGQDVSLIARVRRELAWLQGDRDRRRQLQHAVRQGKQTLRNAKTQLAPVLAALGYHQHGDTIRKLRTCPAVPCSPPQPPLSGD